jgi:protein-L-isoaspartate(D-aspartate) O-methyltransferase
MTAIVLALACPERRDPAQRSAEVADPRVQVGDASIERRDAFSERREERAALVSLLERSGVSDGKVLAAMLRVPRHAFVREVWPGEAYQNRPLPIGYGQTISQPLVVAMMTQAVRPKPEDKCLEIGTGSGYQAAVLAEVCGKVYSIEYLEALADFARSNLRELGYGPDRVELRHGDGYRGWPEAGPFDVVMVTAAPDHVPRPLLDGLALGGRLILPVGASGEGQQLELWTRIRLGRGDDAFERQVLAGVRFVPFLGPSARAPRAPGIPASP